MILHFTESSVADPADYVALQADVNGINSCLTARYLIQTSVAICSFPENEFIQQPTLLNFKPCFKLQVFGILTSVVNSYYKHQQENKEAYWPALQTFL